MPPALPGDSLLRELEQMRGLMPTHWTLPLILVCALGASPVSASPIALTNGHFETGDLSGWQVTIPWGIGEFDGVYPATPEELFEFGPGVDMGFWKPAGVVYTATMPPSFIAMPPRPFSGGPSMAVVGTGDAYMLGDRLYDITAQQSFTMNAGDVLSGWAFFFNGDHLEQDTAWVRVLDAAGHPVATPWQASSGEIVGTAPYLTASPWEPWRWRARTPGAYTLVLGASSSGDDAFDSYGFHDAIQVPEPETLLLVTVGLLVVVGGSPTRASRTRVS
jgi:hypothetical protein